MEITEVRIKLVENAAERLLAFCSITIDGAFVIRDLKLIGGPSGPFVAMPSRKLCTHCREPYDAPDDLIRQLPVVDGVAAQSPVRLWKAVGCSYCGGSGYSGRAAIFELLSVDDAIRKLIKPDVSAGVIVQAARRAGMTSMMADGFRKCREGLTTVEELGRVASED